MVGLISLCSWGTRMDMRERWDDALTQAARLLDWHVCISNNAWCSLYQPWPISTAGIGHPGP